MEISTWSLNFVNRYCTYYLGESIRFDSQEEAWGYTFMEGKIEFRNGNSPRHVISALHETNNYPSWSKIIECLCDQSQQLLANQSRWFRPLEVAIGRYDDHPTWDYCKKCVIFSIGWLRSCWKANSTHSKSMCILMEFCYGKYWAGPHLTPNCRTLWQFWNMLWLITRDRLCRVFRNNAHSSWSKSCKNVGRMIQTTGRLLQK